MSHETIKDMVGYSPTVGMTKVHLAIGMPFSNRPVHPFWALPLICQNWPMAMNRLVIPMGMKDYDGKPVLTGDQRNKIVEMRQDAAFLWMIDDDVEVPLWAARQLLNTMKQCQAKDDKVRVVAGIYPTRNMPVEPVVYQSGMGCDWNWKRNTVFPVTGYVGTGCMMIDCRIFSEIPYPWFNDVNIGAQETMARDSSLSGITMSDDVYFCDKLISAGYKIMADGSVLCRHWDAQNNIAYQLPADCYPMQEENESQDTTETRLCAQSLAG